MQARKAAAIGIALIGFTPAARADTLVLRDGSRVDGTTVSIRDGVVEFGARRGFLGRERVRIDRDEVVRTEFDRRVDDRSDNNFRDDDHRDNDRGDSRDTRRPSGLREREVSVDSWLGWKDTGVEGQGAIRMRSSGHLYLGVNDDYLKDRDG